MTARKPKRAGLGKLRGFFYRRRRNWQLYLILLLPVAHLLIFSYQPMYGLQIAFRNFNPVQGIWGSPWVGFDHFVRFFNSHMFARVLRNTISLSLYSLLAGFPFPIILAFSIHYIRNRFFAKTVQTTTFMPHLISSVVMVGIIIQFFQFRGGVLNDLLSFLPFIDTPVNFLGRSDYFPHIFVWTGIWQSAGFSAVIYIAALSGIDPTLHEAAKTDGASKLRRMWHVDLPGILPTIIILFVLSMGGILSVGFERIYLMQNPLNLYRSEVIATHVYKIGLLSPIPQFSFASAIGLFQSLVGFVLLVIVNWIAKKLQGTALW